VFGSQTPMHKAARMGHRAIVEVLLSHGADKYIKNNVCV
jgi:ankyrin repeat protein